MILGGRQITIQQEEATPLVLKRTTNGICGIEFWSYGLKKSMIAVPNTGDGILFYDKNNTIHKVAFEDS